MQETASFTRKDRLAPQTQAQCLLLALPKECRDLIYALVLTTEEPVSWPSATSAGSLTPALLRTCRQIHAEATPLLYEGNELTFHHPSDCSMFTSITDAKYGRRLKSVTLRVRAGSMDRIWRSYLLGTAPIRSLAADLPNVRSLALSLEGSAWSRHRAPEDNLVGWFSREAGFAALSRTADIISTDTGRAQPVAIRILCCQAVPRRQFDHLYSSRDTLELSGIPGRPALVAESEHCLRMGHYIKGIPWALFLVCTDVPAGE